jgi:hypothetical protein
MDIRLSTLSIILGLFVVLPNAYGVLKPKAFAASARKFPRNTPVGWVLMLVATGWFLYYVSQEQVSDFANLKKIFYFLFTAVGIGTCIFVQDFLPVRGLAVVFLLLAKVMTDSARWVDSEWRLVIATWAYVLAIAGMWWTVSPWRVRDIINWATATEQRTRALSAARLAFGVFVIILGVAVFRPVEEKKRDTPAIDASHSAALTHPAAEHQPLL